MLLSKKPSRFIATATLLLGTLGILGHSGCATHPAHRLYSMAQPEATPGHYVVNTSEVANVVQTAKRQEKQEVVRAQSFDQGSGSRSAFQQPGTVQPIQSNIALPQEQQGQVRPATYQYPELQQNSPPAGSLFNPTPSGGQQFPTQQLGSPSEPNSLVAPTYAPSGAASFPQNYATADLGIYVSEAQTGRINIGGAYNSDTGIVGQFIIDEKNFDIRRWPRNFREIVDGTAWRGAGQQFRVELVPGNNVQRYLVSFTEPYLFDTGWSFNLSGYLFDRNYFDWEEQRIGARMALGYRLTHDVSLSVGIRGENVNIHEPRVNTSAQLNDAVGDTDLYVGHLSLVKDTRDHPFMATEGSYLSLQYSQGFGEVDFPRLDLDYRRYRLLYQRPDLSGRHTLSFGTRLGFTGGETPIFENYYAGGFSTMRGFDFRGASPVDGGVIVGGEFQWLNTLEYTFPLTPDDMLKGVLFCDFGTVEEKIELNSENFRVAPGFGFRVHMPAAGLGAPLAFDFAFPVSRADTDDREVFSFYMGFSR